MSSPFERLVARALRQSTEPGTPCPSADTLGAYLEGALARAERSAIELHASRCARCAAHLAALVQLEDQLAARVPPRPWWRARPWLVPVAAAIVAGVVWTSLPRDRVAELTRPAAIEEPGSTTPRGPDAGRREADGVIAGRGERQAPATQGPAPPAPGAAAKARAAEAPPVQPSPPPAAAGPSERLRKQTQVAPSKEELSDRLEAVGAEPKPERFDKSTARPLEPGSTSRTDAERRVDEDTGARAPAGPPPAAPSDAAAPAPPAHATEPPHTAGAIGATSRPAQEAAKPSAAADAPGAPRQKRAAESLALAGSSPIFTSASDPKVAWRVTGGRIERTTDGGALWLVERAPLLMPPVAGAAPSRDACWLVGNGGVVVRRNPDGTWTRAFVDVPVAGIDARSALEATVVASDGRRLATTDGGRTWIEVR
jgi:hypothetical protein